MGRQEGDSLQASQIMYPCMQCTDIFFLKANITSLGMDQRKVNMLAREYSDDVKITHKPIILSHHMLKSLKEDDKMSKSIPDSAIFMEDSVEDVKRKIKHGFCPAKQVEDNPIFDHIKCLIFPKFGKFELKKQEKFGGDKTYNTYEEMCQDYLKGDLDPNDVKPNVARLINDMIESVRRHFQNDPEAKKIFQLVNRFKISR